MSYIVHIAMQDEKERRSARALELREVQQIENEVIHELRQLHGIEYVSVSGTIDR